MIRHIFIMFFDDKRPLSHNFKINVTDVFNIFIMLFLSKIMESDRPGLYIHVRFYQNQISYGLTRSRDPYRRQSFHATLYIQTEEHVADYFKVKPRFVGKHGGRSQQV